MLQWSGTVNYNLSASTFLEASYGGFYNQIATTPLNDTSNKDLVGLGAFPMLFPDADILDQRFYSSRILTSLDERGVAPPYFVNGRMRTPPIFNWGSRVGNAAAERHRLRLLLHAQPRPERQHQPDEGHGPSHGQGRLLHRRQLQAAERRRRRDGQLPRHGELRQRRQQPARLQVRVRERGARHLLLLPAGQSLPRGQLRLQEHRVVSCRTTGR